MTFLARAAAVLAVMLGGLVATLPAAVASCAEGAGAEGSPVVFVGTAVEERRGYTRFEVDQVWSGPDLAPEVWVLSGQEQPPFPLSLISSVASSVDADFVAGTQYLVGASEDFSTDACRSEQADIALAPSDARSPVDGGSTGADPPVAPVQLVVGAAVLGSAVVLVVAIRRRRRHDRV